MLVGITGSFGSGKTTVTDMFRRLGAYVIDSDKIYHLLIRRNRPCYKKLLRNFGPKILGKDRAIDRKKLADIVFSDIRKLKLLNRITHPDILKAIRRHIYTRKEYFVIVEGAFIIESGFYKELDMLILVKNRRRIIIERLMREGRFSYKEIDRRLKSQALLREKIRRPDFIIDNSGSKEKTFSRVKRIWKSIGGDYGHKH